MPGRVKLVLESLIAIVAIIFISANLPPELATSYAVPFFKDLLLPFGLPLYLIAGLIVIVGSSNAVNLTDGLDGLAIVPTMIATNSFGFIAYLVGNAIFANYLQIHYVPARRTGRVLCRAYRLGSRLSGIMHRPPPCLWVTPAH